MLDGIDGARLALVGLTCLGLAVFGGVLAGDALRSWYPTLVKPRFQISTPLFIGVGIVVYVLEAVVLYRLIGLVDGSPGPTIALASLLVVMVYNELWNAALFRLRSVLAGWIGLLGFLAPLAILELALVLVDPPSAALMFVYLLWVVGYDVPWIYQLWRANRVAAEDAARA